MPLLGLLGLAPKGGEVTLLHELRGVCRPGEMVLVLGVSLRGTLVRKWGRADGAPQKPGSGCTTFLRSVANQRHGYTDVSGEVLYGPFTAQEFRQYRGEAVYNQEDDIHHATLTVEQTLAFALDTKVAGKLPAGMSKKKFNEHVVATLLKMFNIEHARKTVVGGCFVSARLLFLLSPRRGLGLREGELRPNRCAEYRAAKRNE